MSAYQAMKNLKSYSLIHTITNTYEIAEIQRELSLLYPHERILHHRCDTVEFYALTDNSAIIRTYFISQPGKERMIAILREDYNKLSHVNKKMLCQEEKDVLRGSAGGSQRVYPVVKEKPINSNNYNLREVYNITKHYFLEYQKEGRATIPHKEFEFPPFYQVKEYYSLSVSEEAGFVQTIIRTDENNITCGMEIKDFRRIEKVFESTYKSQDSVKYNGLTLGESIKKYEETLNPIEKPKRPLPFTDSIKKMKKKKVNNNTMSKNFILWKMKYANPEKYEELALELLNMLNLPQEEK